MNNIKNNQTIKGALALLCAISITICVMSIITSSVIGVYGAYDKTYNSYRRTILSEAVRHEISTIWQIPMNSYSEFADYVKESNLGADVKLVYWDYTEHHDDVEFDNMLTVSSSFIEGASYDYYFDTYLYGDVDNEYNGYCARAYLYKDPQDGSLAYSINQIAALTFHYRYVVFAAAVAACIIALILLFILMTAAGHRKDDDEIHSHWIDKGLWDINAFLVLTLAGLLAVCSIELTFMDYKLGIAVTLVSVFICALAGVMCMMSLAVQCKTGVILRRSFVGILILSAYRLTRRLAGRIISAWKQLTESLPRTWKAFMLVGLLLIITIIVISMDSMLLLILEALIVLPIVSYLIVNTDQIDKMTESIANGEFGQKLNPKKLFGASRKRAENLNSIDEAVSRAVEERMKSEHFKTELITNVSHDIKTPLTSIINYSELLKQHNCGDDDISAEYIDVIYENSLRLKKLTADIVEASKASSGAIDVKLTELDLGMLVNQCIGEYQERLQQADLSVVSDIEEGITVSADGKLMWRILDNLLSNVCKYSAPDSRVYIDVKRTDTGAQVIIRNISSTQLNITADELMERFIRGDSSRNTEGSGLGLSIARSLAELQNGSLDLNIDGDLFKTTFNI